MAFMASVPGANWGATSMSAMDAPAPAIKPTMGPKRSAAT